MTVSIKKFLNLLFFTSLFLVLIVPAAALALDTDIYAISPRPNVAIQFDTSGSMAGGVYENGVDYKMVYASACRQTFDGDKAYDKDDAYGNGGTDNKYYKMYIEANGAYADLGRNEIVFIKGNPGVSVITRNGHQKSLPGDTGNRMLDWDFDNIYRTNTQLVDGNLVPIDPNQSMFVHAVGDDKVIHLGYSNSQPLPLDRSIKLHDIEVYEDNTEIDLGLAGAMEAPGMYFSGYSYVNNNTRVAQDGDSEIWYMATGNCVHMLLAYQLFDEHYRSNWNYYTCMPHSILKNYTINFTGEESWTTVSLNHPITSPNYKHGHLPPPRTDYEDKNREEGCGNFTQLGATKIKLHFAFLDLYKNNGWGGGSSNGDYIKILDKKTNTELSPRIYSSDNKNSGFYSDPYTIPSGSANRPGLRVHFVTDDGYWSGWWHRRHYDSVGEGFVIDGYKYASQGSVSGSYKMQTRLEVVRDAILYVVDDTRGTINWALARFNGEDGANIKVAFNPGQTNDDTVRTKIVNELNKFTPYGGTPLGESMQDIFNHFHDKQNLLSTCSRNFCILISDGFPTSDTDWSRLDSGVTMTDTDNDGWTSDPSGNNVYPNYLDDVARYMYTHIFRNTHFGDAIATADAPESFNNITTHTLGFAMDLPLLADTALDGGGRALVAKSKQQMINALRSLAMMTIKSASYVAPVISVDTANKTQNGEWLYMAFFKPTGKRWLGNLKKYKLVKKLKDGECADRTEEEWVVTDNTGDSGSDALDCNGQFKVSSKSFWSTEVDGGEVTKGGVGAQLYTRVKAAFTSGAYYTGRNIYVLKNEENNDFPPPVVFNPNNISNSDLGAADDQERYKIINYVYGYTYTADVTTHAPDAYRNWPLGSFIHSNPNLIAYENVDGGKTYIVIGGNDGMIHVFDDVTGYEVVAFIPEDLLGHLKEMNPDRAATGYKASPLFFIDGQTSYYQEYSSEGNSVPKQLIFGLRRGGSSYYSLNVENSDPTKWTLKWHLQGGSGNFAKMGQSWSKIELMKIRTGIGQDGKYTKTIAGVFGGGYDTDYDDEDTL